MFFRRNDKENSAANARNRLQIVLDQERSNIPTFNAMKEELIEVIKRHTGCNMIDVNSVANTGILTLEVNFRKVK